MSEWWNGRHASLRCLCPHYGCAGSNPASDTIESKAAFGRLFCILRFLATGQVRVIGQKVCPVSGHRRRSVPFSVLSAPACSTIRPLMHIFARWSTLGMPPCRSNYAVTWATLVKPQVSESRSNGMNRTPPSDPLCALSLGRPTSKIMHLARFLETRKGVVDCLLIMRLSDRG